MAEEGEKMNENEREGQREEKVSQRKNEAEMEYAQKRQREAIVASQRENQ